jgi:hypothetical protein
MKGSALCSALVIIGALAGADAATINVANLNDSGPGLPVIVRSDLKAGLGTESGIGSSRSGALKA